MNACLILSECTAKLRRGVDDPPEIGRGRVDIDEGCEGHVGADLFAQHAAAASIKIPCLAREHTADPRLAKDLSSDAKEPRALSRLFAFAINAAASLGFIPRGLGAEGEPLRRRTLGLGLLREAAAAGRVHQLMLAEEIVPEFVAELDINKAFWIDCA